MSLIKGEWESYRDEVMSRDSPDIQKAECRRAFYGGAMSALNKIVERLAGIPGEHVSKIGLKELDKIHIELTQFARDVKEGRA